MDTEETLLAEVLVRGSALPVPRATPHGFAVVPSSLDSMAGVELALGGVLERERRLARALQPLRPAYDYILLDCPPNPTLLTTNALYAADAVLVPIEAHPKAYRHFVKHLLPIPHEVQGYRGGPPALLGLLLTKRDATRVAADVESVLRTDFPAETFTVSIPRRTRVAEDSAYQGPVGWYAPTDGTALAYAALAEEVMVRVAH